MKTTNNKGQGFLDYFEDLKDPRINRRKLYAVSEILLVTLAGIICGAEGWSDIEKFGKSKIEELRKYCSFKNGIPSDDTLRRFFRRIDPEEFQTRFVCWVKSLNLNKENLISIDGKVSRHTFDKNNEALHLVSAFASNAKLVLAQTAVSNKSNEITAIPSLLEWLDLKGAIITIDAIGFQRNIAKKIIDKGADYLLSLKGNQSNLNDDTRLIFQDKQLLKELNAQTTKTLDGDHGRIETRTYCAVTFPEILQKNHQWLKLNTVVEVTSHREIISSGKVESEKRYYITSLKNNVEKISNSIRSHWSIENSLHYVMDIAFRDDDSRIRHGNAPQNIAVIKHVALNMLQANKRKRDSIKGLRKVAARDHSRMHNILQQTF